jgi:hypothetical protein
MADPCAESIVIDRINDGNLRAYFLRAMYKFSRQPGMNILSRKRRKQPSCTFEKIGVGKLYARVFSARHRMAGKKSLTGVPSERSSRTFDDFGLGAAHIRD